MYPNPPPSSGEKRNHDQLSSSFSPFLNLPNSSGPPLSTISSSSSSFSTATTTIATVPILVPSTTVNPPPKDAFHILRKNAPLSTVIPSHKLVVPDIGEHHDGSFGTYMAHKKGKLDQQFIQDCMTTGSNGNNDTHGSSVVSSSSSTTSAISNSKLFNGICVYINGYTVPPFHELKILIGQYGGKVDHYLSGSSITHIIAQNLPDSKIKEIRNHKKHWLPVVYPNWILHSIQTGTLLPTQPYVLPAFQQHLNTTNTLLRNILTVQPSQTNSNNLTDNNDPNPSIITPSSPVTGTNHTSTSSNEKIKFRTLSPSTEKTEAFSDPSITTALPSTNASTTLLNTHLTISPSRLPLNTQYSFNIHPSSSNNELNTPFSSEFSNGTTVTATTSSSKPLPSPIITQNIAPSHSSSSASSEVQPSKLIRSSGNDPHFMETYFNASRLHFIGAWRSHVQALVAKETSHPPAPPHSTDTLPHNAETKYLPPSSSVDSIDPVFHSPTELPSTGEEYDNTNHHNNSSTSFPPTDTDQWANQKPISEPFSSSSSSTALPVVGAHSSVIRMIAHVDIDCFFAQVALLEKPHLREKPVVVSHSGGRPSGTSYGYRAFGDGMDTAQADLFPSDSSRTAVQKYSSSSSSSKPDVFIAGVWNGVSSSSSSSSSTATTAADPLPYSKEKQQAIIEGRDISSFPQDKKDTVRYTSGGEVSSANYPARAYGIYAGMTVGTAQTLCPHLIVLPYHFDKIQQISETVYQQFLQVTHRVQAVSCDEAYIDLTGLPNPIERIQQLRKDIFTLTGCTVSAGIGPNMLLARLATSKAKPNGLYVLPPDKTIIQEYIKPMKVSELPGVGWTTESRLRQAGILTIGDVTAKLTRRTLEDWFGQKHGETIWKAAQGIDGREITLSKVRKSIGAEVNWGVRFTEGSQVLTFLRQLATEVTRRLMVASQEDAAIHGNTNNTHTDPPSILARSLIYKLMVRRSDAPEARKFLGHGICDSVSRSANFVTPTCDKETIINTVIKLHDEFAPEPSQIRGIGIQLTKLVSPYTNKITKSSAVQSGPLDQLWKTKSNDKPVNISTKKLGNGNAQILSSSSSSSSSSTGTESLPLISVDNNSSSPEDDTEFVQIMDIVSPSKLTSSECIRGASPNGRGEYDENIIEINDDDDEDNHGDNILFKVPRGIDPSIFSRLPPSIQQELLQSKKSSDSVPLSKSTATPPRHQRIQQFDDIPTPPIHDQEIMQQKRKHPNESNDDGGTEDNDVVFLSENDTVSRDRSSRDSNSNHSGHPSKAHNAKQKNLLSHFPTTRMDLVTRTSSSSNNTNGMERNASILIDGVPFIASHNSSPSRNKVLQTNIRQWVNVAALSSSSSLNTSSPSSSPIIVEVVNDIPSNRQNKLNAGTGNGERVGPTEADANNLNPIVPDGVDPIVFRELPLWMRLQIVRENENKKSRIVEAEYLPVSSRGNRQSNGPFATYYQDNEVSKLNNGKSITSASALLVSSMLQNRSSHGDTATSSSSSTSSAGRKIDPLPFIHEPTPSTILDGFQQWILQVGPYPSAMDATGLIHTLYHLLDQSKDDIVMFIVNCLYRYTVDIMDLVLHKADEDERMEYESTIARSKVHGSWYDLYCAVYSRTQQYSQERNGYTLELKQ